MKDQEGTYAMRLNLAGAFDLNKGPLLIELVDCTEDWIEGFKRIFKSEGISIKGEKIVRDMYGQVGVIARLAEQEDEGEDDF